jgi:hypothetical protein
MIIGLENIYPKWKLLIENTCMLLANGNVTVWIGTCFGMCGCCFGTLQDFGVIANTSIYQNGSYMRLKEY